MKMMEFSLSERTTRKAVVYAASTGITVVVFEWLRIKSVYDAYLLGGFLSSFILSFFGGLIVFRDRDLSGHLIIPILLFSPVLLAQKLDIGWQRGSDFFEIPGCQLVALGSIYVLLYLAGVAHRWVSSAKQD